MKNLLLTLGVLLSTLLNTSLSHTYGQVWTDVYRAGGFGENDVSALITDANGTQYLTGRFEQTISFGTTTLTSAGMHDIYIAARAANRQWLWAVRAGGTGNESASDLHFDLGGDIWLASGFSSDSATYGPDTFTNPSGYGVAISRLSTTGQWRWTTVAVSPAVAFIRGFSIDTNGSATVAGVFGFGAPPSQDSAITFGPSRLIPAGSFDLFVAHLSPAGQWTGAVRAGGTGYDQCYSAVGSANGSLTLTGQFGRLSSSGGGAPTPFGSTVLMPTGQGDGFVARISATNQWEWAIPISGPRTESGFGLAIDAADNIYVVGTCNGPASFGAVTLSAPSTTAGFVAKLNPARQWEWAQAIDGARCMAYGVAIEAGGDVLVTGSYTTLNIGTTTLTASGIYDAFVGLISSSGQWRGAITAGFDIYATGFRFGRNGVGNALVIGSFFGTAVFGGQSVVSDGTSDIFVATLDRTLLGIRATAANEATGAFSLAPNPATGATRVSWPAPATRTAAPIELLDACGRQIGRWTPAVGSTTLLLPISGLPSGLYLVRQGGAAQRLVVE